MPARIVVCCDGTWNTRAGDGRGELGPTNVALFADAVQDGPVGTHVQRVHYHRGVGTRPHERWLGRLFGYGLAADVRGVYERLVAEYEPGDEIWLLGFSRGAFTVRSVAGLLHNCGLLRRDEQARVDEAYRLYRDRDGRPGSARAAAFRADHAVPDVRVRFLGVWDTVGALGVPLPGIAVIDRVNRRWGFHDTRLSGTVEAAFHAVAIDEQRAAFVPALWDAPVDGSEGVRAQVWFAGAHADVGGGYRERGLSDIALVWMADRAREHGLVFRPGSSLASSPPGTDLRADPGAPRHDSRTGAQRLRRPVVRRIGEHDPEHEAVAAPAAARASDDPAGELAKYLARPGHRVAPVDLGPRDAG